MSNSKFIAINCKLNKERIVPPQELFFSSWNSFTPKVRSLITKDVALICLPVLVGDCLLLFLVISEHTLLIYKILKKLKLLNNS